jgi:hypothetical protein
MALMAIFYTGDKRHNLEIAKQNHQQLFDRLKQFIDINIYWFTKDDPTRGTCPYEEGDPNADTIYRRGQGGGIQVWDFVRACDKTDEPYVMRLRTDVWFTPSSIDVICNEVKEIIQGRTDIAYLGSDWIHENAGKINHKLVVIDGVAPGVQDFVIIANRSKMKPGNKVIEYINGLNPKKRRSGNNLFKLLIPMTTTEEGLHFQEISAYRILCQIWLVRKTYSAYPADNDVCKDYIQSYILDDKSEIGKKTFIIPHPMQAATDWWRNQQGWGAQDLDIKDFKKWQLQ